jgi:hypothetical protein
MRNEWATSKDTNWFSSIPRRCILLSHLYKFQVEHDDENKRMGAGVGEQRVHRKTFHIIISQSRVERNKFSAKCAIHSKRAENTSRFAPKLHESLATWKCGIYLFYCWHIHTHSHSRGTKELDMTFFWKIYYESFERTKVHMCVRSCIVELFVIKCLVKKKEIYHNLSLSDISREFSLR